MPIVLRIVYIQLISVQNIICFSIPQINNNAGSLITVEFLTSGTRPQQNSIYLLMVFVRSGKPIE